MTNLISCRRIGPLVMLSLEAKIAVLVKGAVWVANPSSNATISSQLCASSCTCKHINAHTHDWSAVLAPWVKAEYLTNKHNWSSSKSGKAEEPALVVIYDSTFYGSAQLTKSEVSLFLIIPYCTYFDSFVIRFSLIEARYQDCVKLHGSVAGKKKAHTCTLHAHAFSYMHVTRCACRLAQTNIKTCEVNIVLRCVSVMHTYKSNPIFSSAFHFHLSLPFTVN